ncbi:MAG: hypothetical protein IT539_04820 [Bradyrhizobiaceae bacterium]|nr:hypothetical protein [Bradyrhizobiaceae bacterium]
MRGDFQARGQTQERSIRRDVQRRDFDRRVYTRRDNRDWQRFDGRPPRLVHRGWSRDHRHRFFGAFLLGVPFGYTAVVSNPCYDWTYGPYGLGYYWNYDRCPV